MSTRLKTIFTVILAVIFLGLIFDVSIAHASGDDIRQNTKVGGGSYSGGDSWGFGSTDVDINDCLSSYSVLFGLWQDVRVNALCVADKLDAAGKYQEAAEMRCSVRRVRKVYGIDCIERIKTIPPEPVTLETYPMPELMPEAVDKDEEETHEAMYTEQRALINDLQAKVTDLEKLQNLPLPQITKVEQRPLLTESQRTKLAAVLAE